MSEADIPALAALAPNQLSLLRLRAAIGGGVIVALGVVLDWVLVHVVPFPFGLVSGAAGMLAIGLVLSMPPRRYRSWGYALTDEELHIAHGVWVRSRTAVPLTRVQHIDVAQGPLQRRYGLGTLTLHTAGTRAAAIALPGLALEDAEAMRDTIRAGLRAEIE